jgi:hypothetical protein
MDVANGDPIDTVVLAEDIQHGQRVRKWVLTGLTDQWTELASGQSIGHKWIAHFGRQAIRSIRLEITEAVATPIIDRIEAFDTTA